jgi:hypothetical protein
VFIVSKTVLVFELHLVLSEWVKRMLVSSANKIDVDFFYLQTEVNHLCIKEIAGDPGWNPIGLRI